MRSNSSTYNGKDTLTRLEVRNFKSHKSTEVTLTPGINVIVGETDKGKTALMSAIRWVATGKPKGDSVKSWWGGKTSVQLTFGDGVIVEKSRVGTGTTFTVNGRALKSTEGSNPKEVDAALRIPEELCIQRQLDPVYMLSKTGGQAAATINSVVDMEVVTGAQSEGMRAVRQCKSELEAATIEKNVAKEELDGYTFLDELNSTFAEVAAKYEVYVRKMNTLRELTSAVNHAASTEAALRGCAAPPDTLTLRGLVTSYQEKTRLFGTLESNVTFLVKTIEEKRRFANAPQVKSAADALRSKVSVLCDLRREYATLRDATEALSSSSVKVTQATLSPDVVGAVEALINKRTKLQDLYSTGDYLADAVAAVVANEMLLASATERADEAKEAKRQATIVNGLCILCNQPVRST
jgi:hypothetical protein